MVFRRRKGGKADAADPVDEVVVGSDTDAAELEEAQLEEAQLEGTELEGTQLEAAGIEGVDAAAEGESWPAPLAADREGGPWDAAEAPEDKVERVDLGGVQIPIISGMELRAEIADGQVVAVTLVIGQSALQIQPFAAPRTMGIWGEVRDEIAEGVRASGGSASETEGRFGTELAAEVNVALQDGTSGRQAARFIGVDGPRWFLRAVVTGAGATDPSVRAPLEDLLADVIVVRGEDAMAPRDPIPLRLPDEVDVGADGEQFEAAEDEADDEDELKPFERGPEITEIR